MLFKRSYINRAVSALLLVMLLFIHSIKLLHTHNGHELTKNSKSVVIKSATDCSICNYQLNKDAVDLVYPSFCEYEPQPVNFDSQLISFHKNSFHTAFENRGPPSDA